MSIVWNFKHFLYCGARNAAFIVLIACLLSSHARSQVAATGGPWHGNFTGKGVGETLTLSQGLIYFSDEQTPSMVIGDARGYVLGEGGLNVLNLDGNSANRLSLVFFDPTRNQWIRGMLNESKILNWAPVANTPLGTVSALHIGSGAIMVPLEQSVASFSRASGINTAQLSVASLNYPVQGTQYTSLSASQHVWTSFLVLQDGTVVASTRLKEDKWLGGFHAAARIALYSTTSTTVQVTSVDSPVIGVSGSAFGHNDVTVSWTGHISSVALPYLHYYAVVQEWTPNWFTTIDDAAKFGEAAEKVIQPLLSILGKGK